MLFTVIADMRALLRGEHSDTSLSDAATSHSAETPSEMQARHRRSEACLEMQSKLQRNELSRSVVLTPLLHRFSLPSKPLSNGSCTLLWCR